MAASDTLIQACHLGGAVLETLFYGFYLCLFVSSIYLISRRGLGRTHNLAARTTLPSKIFFVAVLAMFVLATFHEIVAIYRLVRGFGLMLGPKGTPLSYYRLSTGWDNFTHTVMNAIMIWIADSLAIYRCYMIWDSSPYQLYVVVLPILLFLSAMGVNITLMVWYRHPFISYEELQPILRVNYPLFFAQSVITTGLIAFALIKRHNATARGNGRKSSLLTVARIVIETAALYTIEMLILIILNAVDHPAQYLMRGAIIPTIGIVFLLMAIRVHFAQRAAGSSSDSLGSDVKELPEWVVSMPSFLRDDVWKESDSEKAHADV